MYMSREVTGVPVPIGSRILALWSPTGMNQNLAYIRSLDPTYFLSIANAVASLDEKREELHASTYFRMARDQSAEMLFSLIASAIQSPAGTALWMTQYRNDELDAVLEAFEHTSQLLTLAGPRALSWNDVAVELTRHFRTSEPATLDGFRQQHARFWSRLAREFLDPIARREFASIKHGLRVRSGGCEITITREITPGVKDPLATPIVSTGTGFGSSFIVPERIGTQKLHYCLSHQHRHWAPESLRMQLELIVNSIKNVLIHLRIKNGDRELPDWTRPIDSEAFELCWQDKGGGLRESTVRYTIEEADIPCLSQEQLIDLCVQLPSMKTNESQ